MKKFKRGLALILAIALVISNAVYSMSSSLKANEIDEAQTQDMKAADQTGEEQSEPEINTEGVDVTVPDQGQQTPEQNTQEETAAKPEETKPEADKSGQDQPKEEQPKEEQPAEVKYNVAVNKPEAEGGIMKAWSTGDKTEVTYDGDNKYRQEVLEGAAFNLEITSNDGYSVDKVTDQNGSVVEPASVNGSVYTYVFSGIKENKEITVLYKENKPEVSKPAKILSETVDGVIVTVSAPEGVLAEGWTLSVQSVSKKSVEDIAQKAAADNGKIEDIKAFDITLKDKDGNEIQPDGLVNVSFANVNMKADNLNVYHIDDSTKNANKVEAAVSGKNIAFSAEHFSTYMVVAMADTEQQKAAAAEAKAAQVTLTFNVNGGSGASGPSAIQASVGSMVTLPEYEGKKKNATFVGWSTDSQATAAGSGHYKVPVYKPGEQYILQKNQTIYAVWASSNLCGDFYIRIDGTIPDEPGTFNPSGYTSRVAHIDNVVKNGYFISDSTGAAVLENLKSLPTDKQIKAALPSYNPETQYIIWYVMKLEGGHEDNAYNIDGVVLSKEKLNLHYFQNTPSGSGVTVDGTFPLGRQYVKGSDVQVDRASGFSLQGYAFKGWNTKADGTGKSYAPGSTFTINEETSLYAQWRPNSGTKYTIEYYLQDPETKNYPTQPNDTQEESGITGASVNAGSKVYDGYVYDARNASNVQSGEITGDGSLILKRYYKIRTDLTYTVKYLEKDTNKELAAGKEIKNRSFGETVTEQALSISGYNLVGDATQSLQISGSKDEIIFYYTKRADLTYTVNYLDKATNEPVKDQLTVGGQAYQDNVTVKAPDIAGYKKPVPSEASITIGLQDNVITFYYEKRIDLKYTVNYLDKESGQKIADSKIVKNMTFGDSVPEAAIEIAGYDKLEPSTGVVKITADEVQNVINFYYTMKSNLSYTVKYLEAGTDEKLADDKTTDSQTFGTPITENAVSIPGYNVVGEAVKSITIQDGTNEIVFYYAKQNDLSYTVNYLEQGTNQVLKDAKSESGMTFKDKVTEEAADIEGYVKPDPASAELIISEDNTKNVINFYYTKRADLRYTVNYLEMGSLNTLKESKTVEGKTLGDSITEDAAQITGYNSTKLTEELTISAGSNVINFYYVKKADLSYTINYYEKGTTNKLADSDVVGGQIFGEEVTVTAKDLKDAGYTVDGETSATFNIKDGENVINFYYTKRADLSYTVRYLEQSTNKPVQDEKTIDGMEFQSEVTETAPDIEGFNKIDPTEATITIGLEENVITFYYARRADLKYTINYLERGTNKPIQDAKKIASQTFGATATETAPDLTMLGYNLDGNSQESIQISADNDKNIINFYYSKRTDLSYEVKYLEAGTDNVLAKGKTVGKQVFDSEVTEKAVPVKGYNLIGEENRSITIGTDKNEIVFYYTKKNDLSYVVNYLEEGTNEILADAKTKSGLTYQDKITEEAISIDGYVSPAQSSAELVVSEDNSKNVINFYYTKRADLSYTVNYKEKGTGETVAPSKTVNNQSFGSKVIENAIDVDGYNMEAPVTSVVDITTDTNEVTFYYSKRTDLSYTVRYLEAGTEKEVAGSLKADNQTFGSEVEEHAVNVPGYDKMEPVSAKLTITSDSSANIITFFYAKRTDLSYTVNYLDQDSRQPVKDAKIVNNQTFQSEVEESAADIDGYTKVAPLNAKLIISENNDSNVINFYYAKRTDLSYTVNYLEEGTNTPVADAKAVSNRTFGESITENAIDVPGYNKTAAAEETIILGTDAAKNVINFYYTKKTDLSYTVKYLEAGTDEKLADDKATDSQTFGTPITENAVSIPGYNVVGEAVKSITIKDGTNEIVFYYAKQNDLSYTVNYLEQGTNRVLKDAKSKAGMTFKDKVTEEAADIDGYVKPDPASAELIISEDNTKNVINFYYTKRADLSYTVNYVDKDTDKAIAEAKTVKGQTFGAVVPESAIDIAGYEKHAPLSQDVKITTGKNEVTFYYTKRTDLSYTVKYLEKGTEREVAKAKTTGDQTFKEEVKEAAIDVAGYNAEMPTTAELIIGADSSANIVVFYYTKKTDLSYKVNYLDQETNEPVMKAKIVGGQTFQSLVTEAAPDADGYTKVGETTKSLTIGAYSQDNVITFYYTKRTDLSYTVNYFEKGTDHKIADSKTADGQTFGDEITESAVDVPGYNKENPTSESLKITTNQSENVINFYYTKKTDLSYTVKYLEDGTGKVLASEKSVGSQIFGSNASEKALEIPGYNPTKASQSITIQDGTNEIVFTYTKKTDLSYAVKYLEVDTDAVLADEKAVGGRTFEETVTETAADIAGYNVVGEALRNLTIQDGTNEIIFYYAKQNDLAYTVNYLEEGSNAVLAQPKSVGGQTFQSEVTETAVDIDGYVKAEPSEAKLIISEDNAKNVINFYYTKRTDLSYTVNYLEYGTGTQLHEAKTVDGQTFGTTVTETAETVDGYYAVQGSQDLMIQTGSNVINFYYVKRADLSYQVHYYLDGEEQSDLGYTEENQLFGTEISEVEDKMPAGYILEKTENLPLQVGTGANEIHVYYTLDVIGEGENPDEGDQIPDKYQVVVNYEAVNGTVNLAKTVVTLLDEQGNPSENGAGTLKRIASASASEGFNQESLSWTPGTPMLNMEIKEAMTFTAAFTAVPVPPVTPGDNGTTPVTPATPGNPTAPGTPTQPTTPGAIYRTITQPITQIIEAAGEAIDANVRPLVSSDDEGVPLANKASKDHKCCILHFLLLLLALGVEIAYTRSMKKRQQRIFELQEELALTEQEIESNEEDIAS